MHGDSHVQQHVKIESLVPNTQWSQVSPVDRHPFWLKSVREQLDELTNLQDNWDSYGSSAIKREVAAKALEVISVLSRLRMEKPSVIAVPGGGVQFEWANSSSELELEIRPNGAVEFLIVDQNKEMREGPVDTSYSPAGLFGLSIWFLNEKKSVNELFQASANAY